MSDEKTNFFAEYMEWNPEKVVVLLINILILIVSPIMMGAVVWYDHKTVDLLRKNLISQMLSNLCKSLLALCIINGLYYLYRIFSAPMAPNQCDGVMFFGRWTFMYLFTHTCTRQFFKVLFIYNYKFVVRLNEDFVAFYATVMVAVFTTYFTFATYMLGFHNSDLDYHICTGNHPTDNIKMAMNDLKLPFNPNVTNRFSDQYMEDPLKIYIKIMFGFFIIFLFQTWFYSYIMKLASGLKGLLRRCLGSCSTSNDAVNAFSSGNDIELKQIMMGTTLTVVIFASGFLSLLPYLIIQPMIEENPSLINKELRVATHFSKVTIPFFFFIVMPFTFILFHRKFRNYIARELEARPIMACTRVTEEVNEIEFNGAAFD